MSGINELVRVRDSSFVSGSDRLGNNETAIGFVKEEEDMRKVCWLLIICGVFTFFTLEHLRRHKVTDVTPDIRLTFYNAGHALGSAMIHLNIGNGLHNLLYCADFKLCSRESCGWTGFYDCPQICRAQYFFFQ